MHPFFRRMAAVAAILMVLAVAAGAWGAHALKPLLPPEKLNSFETAVRYQIYHALAVFLVCLFSRVSGANSRLLKWTNILFLCGIILFSGSIYFLALQGLITSSSLNWLGPVTPLGGLCFLAGWTCLAISFFRPSKVPVL